MHDSVCMAMNRKRYGRQLTLLNQQNLMFRGLLRNQRRPKVFRMSYARKISGRNYSRVVIKLVSLLTMVTRDIWLRACVFMAMKRKDYGRLLGLVL